MKRLPALDGGARPPEIVIEGVDLKIHDSPEAYREAVAQIKYDPLSLGALVTTHKIDLFNAARDMFDYFDPYADHVRRDLEHLQARRPPGRARQGPDQRRVEPGRDHRAGLFRAHRRARAVLWRGRLGGRHPAAPDEQAERADRPEKFIVVNRSQGRLDSCERWSRRIGTDIAVETSATRTRGSTMR